MSTLNNIKIGLVEVSLAIAIFALGTGLADAAPPFYENEALNKETFQVTCITAPDGKVICISPNPDLLKNAKHFEIGNLRG